MKAFVTKSSEFIYQGEIRESETLEMLCSSLLDTEDFNGFKEELVISKPDMDHPFDEREKECDWVIEIYDDYRE